MAGEENTIYHDPGSYSPNNPFRQDPFTKYSEGKTYKNEVAKGRRGARAYRYVGGPINIKKQKEMHYWNN